MVEENNKVTWFKLQVYDQVLPRLESKINKTLKVTLFMDFPQPLTYNLTNINTT